MSKRVLRLDFPYFREGLSMLSVPSTNDMLAYELSKGRSPQVVTAAVQTEGRGRRDNIWYSEKGGLWVSFLLPDIIPQEEMTMLNISCGLSCVRACERLLKHIDGGRSLKPFMRWPNDIILKGKKLGGMLIEVKSMGSAERTYIMGVGINVNQEGFPHAIKERAISLFQVLKYRVSRMRLLFLMMKELETMIAYVRDKGTQGLLLDWQEYSYELGKHIEISTGKNQRKQGKVIGIGEKGELTIIDSDDEIARIYNGYNLKILDK